MYKYVERFFYVSIRVLKNSQNLCTRVCKQGYVCTCPMQLLKDSTLSSSRTIGKVGNNVRPSPLSTLILRYSARAEGGPNLVTSVARWG